MKNSTLRLAVFISVVLESDGIGANKIHVGQTGSDSASGSAGQPYLTINKAASVAQPGDTVIVHGGTYREWVKPIRGGTSESNRIVYRAAPGEEVLVKGSERVTSWIPEGEGVWKVEVPNSYFSDYNPYELTLSGGWLNYGQWHHRGDVYLNGEAFEDDCAGSDADRAHVVLPGGCECDDDPGQLRQGKSQHGADRDQCS
jgi:hypothetical protein